LTPKELAVTCAAAAAEKKAQDILLMDLKGISIIADYFVVCTGSNTTQVQAICNNISEKLSEKEKPPLRIEGFRDARWILMDFGSTVVHIFQQEEREYYNLERLWGDAKTTFFQEQENQ